LQKLELISVKRCQSDTFWQAATPPVLKCASAPARAPYRCLCRPGQPAPSQGRIFPRMGALRSALKFPHATCRVFPRRSAAPPWTAALPCTCAPTKAAAVPQPRCRHSLRHEASGSHLFKDLAPTTGVSSSLPPRARHRPP
jgi:hypothetical protein